jgi:hypothetical protein
MITKVGSNFDTINILNQDLPTDLNYTFFIRQVMNSLKEPSDVNEILQAIENLHQLLKLEKKLFVHTFDNVYDDLKKFIFNENPEIVRATLFLLSEVLSISWMAEQVKDWSYYLIPQFIRLKMSKESLDQECQFLLSKCLDSIPKFCLYEETALILLKSMSNKNSEYTDIACELFRKFMINSQKEFIVDAYEWNEIFENIFFLFPLGNKKRIIAENIILFFRNELFTNEQWEIILSKLEDEFLQDLIIIVKFDYSSVYDKKKKLQLELKRYGGN